MNRAESDAPVERPLTLIEAIRAQRAAKAAKERGDSEQDRVHKEQFIDDDWSLLCPKYGRDGPYPLGSPELADAVKCVTKILKKSNNLDHTISLDVHNRPGLPHLPRKDSTAVQRVAQLDGPRDRSYEVLKNFYVQAARQLRDGFVNAHSDFSSRMKIAQGDPSVIQVSLM